MLGRCEPAIKTENQKILRSNLSNTAFELYAHQIFLRSVMNKNQCEIQIGKLNKTPVLIFVCVCVCVCSGVCDEELFALDMPVHRETQTSH